MSGETEENVSAWTIDSLRYHLEQIATDLDKRYEQRFKAQEGAIENAFDAQEKAVRNGFNGAAEHVDGQLDVIRARINGMDEATRVLHETVTRFPTAVDLAVGHLKQLHNEKFDSVQTQFKERDTRSERESRDNKVAVDAAFAAQKEAASEQNKSNTLAISKSEEATKETLATLAELFRTEIAALAARNDDLKDRIVTLDLKINTITATRQGEGEQRQQTQQNLGAVYALAGLILTLMLIGGAILAIKPG